MKSYIGTKIIQAEKMTDIEFEAERHVYNEAQGVVKQYQNGGHLLRSDHGNMGEMRAHREPKDGYKVMYPDGYFSWSPANTFEEAYRLVSEAEKKIV